MRIITHSILLLIVFSVSAGAVTNLLPDGGLEEGQWKLIKWDRGEGTLEFSGNARSGSKCIQLTGISEGKAPINLLAHSQPVNVKSDGEYVLTLWHQAADKAIPRVSILGFKEPWASAQWKTPQTLYETRALPQRDGWAPWSWRFRVPAGTAQLIVALRNSGPGSVWFDDVALFEAGETHLNVTESGTITELPQRRRLKANVALGTEASTWKLSVIDAVTGKPLGAEEGNVKQKAVAVSYSAADDAALTLVLEDAGSRAVLATQELVAPRLVALDVVSPRYRHSIYLSQKLTAIHTRLDCAADAGVRSNLSYSVKLNQIEVQPWTPMNSVNDLQIPLKPRLPARPLQVKVLLKGVPGHEELSATFKVVPPASEGREVIIGDNNETLVDGKPFFPAGFYGPRIGPQFDPIAKAGYTAALTYDSRVEFCLKWLDECKRLGLLGMVSLPHPFVAKFNESELRDAISSIKEHPALLGYYLYDEPYVNKPGQTPADLKRVYDVVASEDPYHPIGVCICVPEYFRAYVDCYDMVMPDPYPLVKSVRPLTYVSNWIDTAREAIGNRKPVWVVPQSFGWDIIENIPNPEAYRTPTPQQERCMSYLALTHGVSGVMYYCYHVYTRYDAAKKQAGGYPYILGGYLPDSQIELWSALEKLGLEIRALGPALLRPGAESGVQGSVHWRLLPKSDGETAWLIAVNADTTRSADATLKFEKWNVVLQRVAFGDGKVAPADGGLSVSLPAMGTMGVTVEAIAAPPQR